MGHLGKLASDLHTASEVSARNYFQHLVLQAIAIKRCAPRCRTPSRNQRERSKGLAPIPNISQTSVERLQDISSAVLVMAEYRIFRRANRPRERFQEDIIIQKKAYYNRHRLDGGPQEI